MKIYVTYCENEFSFISFTPLTGIYDDCIVFELSFTDFSKHNILNFIHLNNTENDMKNFLHGHHIKYNTKYYGM